MTGTIVKISHVLVMFPDATCNTEIPMTLLGMITDCGRLVIVSLQGPAYVQIDVAIPKVSGEA